MKTIEALKTRYSTKSFNPEKTITPEQILEMEQLLTLSPSSTNIQPWYFVMATTEEGKKRVAKAAHGFYSFNEAKVLDAQAVVVFASKVELDDDYLDLISAKEEEDGRFATPEFKAQNHMARSYFAKMHKYDLRDFQHWAEKQVYLNIGCFMLGIATMGLDSIAMEGFDFKLLDEEFQLREKGFTSCVVISVGYHSDTDFNKKLPKSRFETEDIITKV